MKTNTIPQSIIGKAASITANIHYNKLFAGKNNISVPFDQIASNYTASVEKVLNETFPSGVALSVISDQLSVSALARIQNNSSPRSITVASTVRGGVVKAAVAKYGDIFHFDYSFGEGGGGDYYSIFKKTTWARKTIYELVCHI